MNDNLTLGCILLFNADRHLLAQVPITPVGGDGIADQDQMQIPGVPYFAAVINADGDVIGRGPIENLGIQVQHFPELAHELIRRLDTE